MTAAMPTHDELVASMTGGMVPEVEPFAGSDRLRPDGRPHPELMAELRRIPNLLNAWTCVAAVAMPALVVAAVVALDHWLAVALAIPVMAVLQNRMFILHHEGSHRSLFSNRRINDVVGINFFGWVAFGTGTHGYRRGHSNHHRDEFGPKEPDFLLYSFYPIKAESMRRKLLRDATGVSAWRVLKPRITGVLSAKHRVNSLRFYAGQAVIFALFALTGHPWLYLFLWVAPYVFVYQVLNRLRAVAEHGGLTRSDDRRKSSHHVRQSLVARAIFVPIGVGRHLAHHVDSGIPFRNLARFEQILTEDGYITPEITWPSYRALWKALASG
ncbi:MAG: fatty acid desaturase [Acidimicrobiales bacterium]|nr:fatty acid desaturase [Acidimicrobiales bacterium]